VDKEHNLSGVLEYWSMGVMERFQITIIEVSGGRFSVAGGSGKKSQELKPEH
jgi:hypothetical protein